MINNDKLLNYIKNTFNINIMSYDLISEIIDLCGDDINKLIKILNNCSIDITLKEIKNINKED